MKNQLLLVYVLVLNLVTSLSQWTDEKQFELTLSETFINDYLLEELLLRRSTLAEVAIEHGFSELTRIPLTLIAYALPNAAEWGPDHFLDVSYGGYGNILKVTLEPKKCTLDVKLRFRLRAIDSGSYNQGFDFAKGLTEFRVTIGGDVSVLAPPDEDFDIEVTISKLELSDLDGNPLRDASNLIRAAVLTHTKSLKKSVRALLTERAARP